MAGGEKAGFWRGVAGFAVLVIGYLVAAMIIELMFAIANMVSHGWPDLWGRVLGAALGAAMGVAAGRIALDAVVKHYPDRPIAATFIALNLLVIVGDLMTWGEPASRGLIVVQIVRATISIAAAIYFIWLGRGSAFGIGADRR